MSDLPSGWKSGLLHDLAAFSSGEQYPGIPSDFGEIPIMGANGVIGWGSRSNYENGYLIGRVGAAGAVNRIDSPCWVTDNALMVYPYARTCDQGFLGHLLQSLKLNQLATRQAQPLITQSTLRALAVKYPANLGEQRRIAEILDALDSHVSSIERNLSKVEIRNTAAIATLLDECDEPLVPLGVYLRDRPKNGFSPKEVDGWTGMKALGLGCLTPQGFRPVQVKDVPVGDVRNGAAILADGDLLVSRANTRDFVGLAGIYRDIGSPCIYPDLMMRIRCKPTCLPEFLELLLRSARVRRQIQAHAQGTSESMVKISSAIVLGLRVRLPKMESQRRILRTETVLREEVEQLRAERWQVLAMRSGLAEDLLTGRVRV